MAQINTNKAHQTHLKALKPVIVIPPPTSMSSSSSSSESHPLSFVSLSHLIDLSEAAKHFLEAFGDSTKLEGELLVSPHRLHHTSHLRLSV